MNVTFDTLSQGVASLSGFVLVGTVAVVTGYPVVTGVAALTAAAGTAWYALKRWRKGVVMPHGTEDAYDTAVVADACYDAIFNLVMEGKLSVKKEKHFVKKIAKLLGSQSLVPRNTHPRYIQNRVMKNCVAMHGIGPKGPIPGAPEPASVYTVSGDVITPHVSRLKVLKDRQAA